MRRFGALIGALALALAVAAPVAAGPNVSNTSSSFIGAEGDWSLYDEGAGLYDYGYLFARLEKGQKTATVDFQRAIESDFVDCGKTKHLSARDTGPGGEGDYSYTYVYGFGPTTTFAVPKSMDYAQATATLDLYYDTHVACTDVWESGVMEGVTVALDLTATGPVEKLSDRMTFHVSGEVNAWSSVKQVTRPGAGTVTVDGVELSADFGIIGSVSWMDHQNG